MADDVPFRDYFDAKLETINQRLAAIDRATEIQTKELARRLDELNHAHQRAVEDKATFLPREIFDATRAEWQTWRDGVNSTLDQGKGRAAMLAAVVSLAISILFFVISRVWK